MNDKMLKNKIVLIVLAIVILSLTACSALGGQNIKVTKSSWYPINESYLDPAIQVRFDVENVGEKTVLQYAVKMELYDDDGKYLTSFTADSNHSLEPGETEDGNIHLEPTGIDVEDVAEVKVSIIEEVTE